MNQLVFVESNRVVTDSLTVAEVFGKDHDKVVRDIRNQIEKLLEAGESEWSIANFGETQYQHPQNKQMYTKFNLTEEAFTIVAMSYVTPDAMKMKVKFIREFKRMREQLNPRSQLEILQSSINQLVEQERRLALTENRLNALEQKQENITEIVGLTNVDWRKKVNGILQRIAKVAGGFDAYKDIRSESYKLLESRASCNLSIRLTNKRSKMALEGASKSKVDKVTKMDVIADDGRLTEIYLAVVKEMAIRYNTDVSDLTQIEQPIGGVM